MWDQLKKVLENPYTIL